ncbi:MAG: DMT family transporter [Patescibacteria group bacterium]|jgi:drug/metabolite transporter (DMT)-like permease
MKKGIILILTTAVISGFSIFINQFGVKVINSDIFAGLKNITVALLLFAVILLFREWVNFKKLSKKDWLTLIIIGLVGGSVPFLMFFKGLSLSTAPEAAYIHKFLFVFIIILAPLILKEKLQWHYLLGFVFLIMGSALLFKVNGNFTFNKGNLLILGATFIWAIENIIAKKAVATISPRLVAWGRMGFGSLFILIYLGFTHQLGALTQLTLTQFSWVFLSALLLLGYVLTWYTGLKYIPLSFAAAILSLGALITALLEITQGKAYSTTQIIGLVLMVFGISVILWLKKILCLRSAKLVASR